MTCGFCLVVVVYVEFPKRFLPSLCVAPLLGVVFAKATSENDLDFLSMPSCVFGNHRAGKGLP